MYEIESMEQYQEVVLRKSQYNQWAKQYQKKSGWTVIPVNVIPPVKFDNDDRSALEVWEWKHNPPDRYFLYVHENATPPDGFPYEKPIWEAQTWTGRRLGQYWRKKV